MSGAQINPDLTTAVNETPTGYISAAEDRRATSQPDTTGMGHGNCVNNARHRPQPIWLPWTPASGPATKPRQIRFGSIMNRKAAKPSDHSESRHENVSRSITHRA
jgi:hypothetical protein